MQRTTSADSTEIAFTATGSGPVVVIVNGAMSTAADAAGMAASLADAGFTAVSYDRRARGASGDTRPSTPANEVEDLAAVIDAVGGRASVLGHSSGAVLALYAAAAGVPVEHLFCSEPPFFFETEPAPAGLPERLQDLVDAGHPDRAVVTFQLEAVRLPPELVEQIRSSPMFAGLVLLAQSVVYDAALTREVPVPSPAMVGVTVPVTVLLGSGTFPMLETSARNLADLIDGAELVEVPESVGHRPDPEATARVVAGRIG
jgi:pimeloyl-ACP methyl ester carboxylesterase